METRDDTGKVWGERIGMIPIAHNKRGQRPGGGWGLECPWKGGHFWGELSKAKTVVERTRGGLLGRAFKSQNCSRKNKRAFCFAFSKLL